MSACFGRDIPQASKPNSWLVSLTTSQQDLLLVQTLSPLPLIKYIERELRGWIVVITTLTFFGSLIGTG